MLLLLSYDECLTLQEYSTLYQGSFEWLSSKTSRQTATGVTLTQLMLGTFQAYFAEHLRENGLGGMGKEGAEWDENSSGPRRQQDGRRGSLNLHLKCLVEG